MTNIYISVAHRFESPAPPPAHTAGSLCLSYKNTKMWQKLYREKTKRKAKLEKKIEQKKTKTERAKFD